MLAPPRNALTPDAQKRLEAIESLEELGSGFTLATHDLEIRGAGELLGEGQSGQIQAIGFTLYNELLGRAVAALRAGQEPDLEDPFAHGTEIAIGLPALIPEDYMPDVHMRLVHYKRIANCRTSAELDALKVELIDRFGLLPPPLKTLFAVTALKQLAGQLGIAKIQAGAEGGSMTFAERSRVDPTRVLKLIESDSKRYRLDGPYKLKFSWTLENPDKRISAIEKLLKRLGADETTAAAA
jgi:transcription-repair coupling factor (superfamily II helicase)